jgi:hypothetical protein
VAVEWGIITSVVPPGSWHYPQKLSSGQEVKITGFSFEQLLENMLDFRRRHIELCGAESAYIEQVRADLKAYLCATFPQNCADSRTAPQSAHGIGIVSREYHRPIDRAGDWLANIADDRPEFLDLGLANARAEICAMCPQNIRWVTPCAPCNETIEVRMQNFKGNLRTPLDRRLHLCRVYGHLNQVAVWLKNTGSTPLYPPPENCWKANESRTNT